jgi:flavodoxin
MKQPARLLLAAACAALLPLCACAKEPAATANPNPKDTDPMNPTPKALVAVFSATGTTKGVAERLAAAIGADLYEIAPETPYSMADLDWRNQQSRSSVEMTDRTSRPAIAGAAPDLAAYGTVFVGFPIWWYREPSIVDTFVESNAGALAGKTVVPFATSGGSGMGDSSDNLQALAPAAKVVEGRRFPASVSADALKAWAEGF